MSNKGKDLILEKCFALLVRKGFDAVSISDIQKETGMSRGIIYHYYKSKEELFMEVVERYLLELFRINLNEIKDFNISQMITFTELIYSDICTNKLSIGGSSYNIINLDFLFFQGVTRDKEFEKRYKRVRDDELRAWITVVENSIKLGEINNLSDSETVAKTFVYIIDGAWFNIGYRMKDSNASVEITKMLTDYYNQIKTR